MTIENNDKITLRNLTLDYSGFRALHGITMGIPKNKITAIIGPSGCGKTTLLRCINRMHDLAEGRRMGGEVLLDGIDVRTMKNVNELRRRVGMVFQKPVVFPMSVYDNVAYGPRTHGVRDHDTLNSIVQKALQDAALWTEVENRLDASATGLSGGQQQRLCIARALAVEPEVLLMDEPTSALDPISMAGVEKLLLQLREHYTIVIVTHNMQQAHRVADLTAFFLDGNLVEYGPTQKIFESPEDPRTADYVHGRFG